VAGSACPLRIRSRLRRRRPGPRSRAAPRPLRPCLRPRLDRALLNGH
jgi:hypothetical protein